MEEDRIKEEKAMTLADYLAKKKPVGLNLPEPRKPGEGVSDQEKKQWAPTPVEKKPTVAVVTAETEVVTPVIGESSKHLSALGEFFNVRIKDDARTRQRQNRFEEEQRRNNKSEDRPTPGKQPVTEEVLKSRESGKRDFNRKKNPPKDTKENFPALSTTKA